MKHLRASLAALTAVLLLTVPALAAGTEANPSTGDHSMVVVALAVMGVAAVVIIVLLFFTRKKK